MNSTRGLVWWLQEPAEYLIYVAAHNGLNPRVTSTYRSYAKQKRLYEAYLRGDARFPAAPPGRSLHQAGRAFDMVVNQEWGYRELGRLWQRMGGRWGGERDRIHFEA